MIKDVSSEISYINLYLLASIGPEKCGWDDAIKIIQLLITSLIVIYFLVYFDS